MMSLLLVFCHICSQIHGWNRTVHVCDWMLLKCYWWMLKKTGKWYLCKRKWEVDVFGTCSLQCVHCFFTSSCIPHPKRYISCWLCAYWFHFMFLRKKNPYLSEFIGLLLHWLLGGNKLWFWIVEMWLFTHSISLPAQAFICKGTSLLELHFAQKVELNQKISERCKEFYAP